MWRVTGGRGATGAIEEGESVEVRRRRVHHHRQHKSANRKRSSDADTHFCQYFQQATKYDAFSEQAGRRTRRALVASNSRSAACALGFSAHVKSARICQKRAKLSKRLAVNGKFPSELNWKLGS